jgi:hypothetical protein
MALSESEPGEFGGKSVFKIHTVPGALNRIEIQVITSGLMRG